MLTKIKKYYQQVKQLRQECFEARKDLIVVKNQEEARKETVGGCIEVIYDVRSCMVDEAIKNTNPESMYFIIGPTIRYCCAFDSKHLLEHPCNHQWCGAYQGYKKFLEAYKKLQKAKGKIK